MISKYFSTWLALFFFIWFLGYIFNIDVIIKYINPYYTSILILIGFIITTMYYIFIKKYKYDYSFFIFISIIHISPIILSYYLIKNKRELKPKLHDFLFSPKKSFLEVKMSNANENHLLGRPKNFIDIKKKFMNKS